MNVRMAIRPTGRFQAGIQETFMDSGREHAGMAARARITLFGAMAAVCQHPRQGGLPILRGHDLSGF